MDRLRKSIKTLLLNRGVSATRTVDLRLLRQFFERARPIRTQHPLIRVGSDHDGGYLIPDDLQGVEACFAPGAGPLLAFPADLAKRGIKCFLADPSIEALPQNHPLDFEQKYVSMSENASSMSLEQWVERKARDQSEFVLQMDIEGDEYEVIFDTSNAVLKRFRVIVIEFHNLFWLSDPSGFKLISLAFSKLLKNFEVVHMHPNNYAPQIRFGGFEIPTVLEVTFLRKDRIRMRECRHDFPHALDTRNAPQRDDLVLPRCWYE